MCVHRSNISENVALPPAKFKRAELFASYVYDTRGPRVRSVYSLTRFWRCNKYPEHAVISQ